MTTFEELDVTPDPSVLIPVEIFPRTDAGNAELFANRFGGDVRYDHGRGRWLLFTGHRWVPDPDGSLIRLAKDAARHRYQRAVELEERDERHREASWAIQSESRTKIEATLALAKSEPPIADRGDGWDADPWLLGVANGVIDLRTGNIRAGRQEDRITLALDFAYEPNAQCPRWMRFLDEVFGDPRMVAFLWRAIGYTLTGSTREQVWFVCHGRGSNGKSVLLNTLRRLLAPLAANLPFSAIERGQKSIGGFDLAPLAGKRFVSSSETNEGARIDESRVKMLTGGDVVTAAFKYENAFTFTPMAKLWVALNHLPRVDDDTDSFWRRVRLIPFARQFTGDDIDQDLEDKLAAEIPGILNWAIEGCLAWQDEGLNPPDTVVKATSAYRETSDALGAFIAERCLIQPDAKVKRAEIFKAYQQWCADEGIPDRERIGERTFGQRIGERFENTKSGSTRAYRGIGLLSRDATSRPGDPEDLLQAAQNRDATAPLGTVPDSRPSFSEDFFRSSSHVESFLETTSLTSLASQTLPCPSCGGWKPLDKAECLNCLAAKATMAWKAGRK